MGQYTSNALFNGENKFAQYNGDSFFTKLPFIEIIIGKWMINR